MDPAIFDIHSYCGASLFQKSLSEEQLETRQGQYPNLEHLLIPAKPFDYCYRQANRELLSVLSRHETWHGAVRVDPWRLQESLDMISKTALRALFLHPFEEHIYPTHDHFQEVVEAAGKRGLLVILACGYLPYSHAAQVLPLIRNFPEQPFLLTHGGQINICGLHLTEAFEIFSSCSNSYFESSGIYRQDYIEQAVSELGPERVLFGSGSPHYDFDYELKRILHLQISASDRSRILYHNARSLLGYSEN
jgi:uncharacterized protein